MARTRDVVIGAIVGAASLRPGRRNGVGKTGADGKRANDGAARDEDHRAAPTDGAPDDRGRAADRPAEIPRKGWRDIALRVKRELDDDNMAFLAAGVAFYAFLSIFPALAALVSLYGLVANPADVQRHMAEIAGALPTQAREILETQMQQLATGSSRTLGLSAAFGILLALWTAKKGVAGLFSALNVVYDEKEKRGFVKLNALTLLFTLGGVVVALIAVAMVVGLPIALQAIGLGGAAEIAVSLLRWPILAAFVLGALALIYRYGAARNPPRWRWVSWGSGLATALWLLGSAAFSLYVSRFGSFDKTYGSVAAVVILLLWLNLSAYVVLLGAELNAEMEHQTAKDTTVGPPRRLGDRGAYDADTIGATP